MDHSGEKKLSVTIIACSIGKLRGFFGYFVHFSKINSTHDFIIVIDRKPYYNVVTLNLISFLYDP
jgi:hypothetical protein